MQKYTQAQIDEAIEALEIFGNNPHVSSVEHEDPIVDNLAFAAWSETDIDGSYASINLDALEAAVRLREGKLPGTPEWGSSEEDCSEEDCSDSVYYENEYDSYTE